MPSLLLSAILLLACRIIYTVSVFCRYLLARPDMNKHTCRIYTITIIKCYQLTKYYFKFCRYLLGRPDMNHHTCGAIFNAYALANRLDLALATWNELANRGFDIGPFGSSALIKACARARNIGAALQVCCWPDGVHACLPAYLRACMHV